MPYGHDSRTEDKFLVEELLSNRNERAFRVLYEKYRGDIYAYSRSILKSDANAEEVVQDVFLKLWTKAEGLNPELSLKAYLFTIARNISFNLLAKATNNLKLREQVFYDSQEPSLIIEDELDEDIEVIKEKAISTLPPKRRAIFLMSRNRGMTYEDIGEELDISTSTVKTQMSKALDNLRTYLRLHTDLTICLMIFLLNQI